MSKHTPKTLHQVVALHPVNLLQFRMRKLMSKVVDRVAARTEMFNPERTPGDISEAAQHFPLFLVTYMAVAWAIYIAHALPQEDAQIYSSKYLDLTMSDESFLSVLVGRVIEENLLPEYRLGYLMAMLECCHMTVPLDAQRRIWRAFVSQLSNLFASMCSQTQQGIQIFEEYSVGHGMTDQKVE